MSAPTFLELARQALSSTRRGYDLLAPKFEETPYATPTEWIESSLTQVERMFASTRPERRGLDLACGTGRGVRALRKYCTTVEGLDFSAGMLEQAARLSQETEGVEWVCSDLDNVRLTPERYDRIVTYGAWGHILPGFRFHLLTQVMNALRPGGVFLTLTSNEPRIWEKRFWYYLIFDLAIWLRNRLWFQEFHMYYRLNSTARLMASLQTVVGGNVDFELLAETLDGFEDVPLTLVMLRRLSS